MKLLALVLFVTFEGLFADYASSQCISLHNTSLNNCFRAGFNGSEFNGSRPQQYISSLVTSMKTKFNSCSNSSLSTLMACSLFVPKCSTASSRRLPCEGECRNFFRGCQHGSSENEGLMALLRGLCDLRPPCSPLLNNSHPEGNDNVMCKRLNIKQCADAGYNFTTVSSAYQKLVGSSAIFRNSGSNSTLRKIICMEVAPPCDYKNNLTLYVPCKSTCDSAYKESKQQFLDVFKSNDYCSVFPTNKSTAEQEYCALQAWPDVGYWPSDLWKSILTAEPRQTSTVNTSMPTGISEPTTNNRTDNGTTKEPAHSSTTVTHPGASLTTTAQVPTTTMAVATKPRSNETTTASKRVPTTSLKVSPNASSTAVSENKGNTSMAKSVSTTIVQAKTATTMVGGGNRTLATSLKVSSTTPKPVPTTPLKVSPNAPSTAVSENKGNTTMAKSVSTTIVQAKTATTMVGGGNRTLATSLKVSLTTPKPVPTTPLKVSPNAPSTAVSENKGNTTMAKSVSTTIVQAKTTTTLVTTPKASPNATVHGGRNSTIASSLKVSSTTSSMAVSGSNKSTTLPTPSMSTTKMRGSMTLTVQTSLIVSPSARSATETGIQTSTTNTATIVSTTISHGAIPVPTSVVPSATSTLRPETKGKVPGNQTKTGKKLSTGVIVAIVFGILAGLAAIVVGVIFLRRYKKRKAQYSHSLMVDMDEL